MEGAHGRDHSLHQWPSVVEQPRQGDRQFGDPPRVRDVAEVDDPVRQSVLAADEVVVGQIEVSGLDGQSRADRGNGRPRLCGRGLDGFALDRIADRRRDQGDDLGGRPQIPLQPPLGAGVVEIGQCQAHLPGDPPHPGRDSRGEPGLIDEGPAGQELQHSGDEISLRGRHHAADGVAAAAQHLGDAKPREGCSDLGCGFVLGDRVPLREGRVGQLQDGRYRASDQEVLILLAAQWLQAAVDAESGEHLCGLGQRQRRRRQLGLGMEVERCVGQRHGA